jgi:2,5-diketo-D-gluconate reductase B
MTQSLSIENSQIPIIGFGTWRLYGKNCIDAVHSALDLGYRHLDTAHIYENEKEVGEGIKNSGVARKEIFVTTKVAPPNLSPSAIRKSADLSLQKLGTDYIDLFLIHWPSAKMDLKACLETMMQLKEDSKIKHIGVSNFSPTLFQRSIDTADVICNQLEFTPYVPEFENLKIAKENGTMITAYSPLDKGRISHDTTLTEIGKSYNKTPAQISLRWLIQLGNVSVIPKASSEKHQKENLEIFDFELREEDMKRISKLGEKAFRK